MSQYAHSAQLAASRPRLFILGLFLSWMGCAGGPPAFGPAYPDNRPTEIEAVMRRISTAPARQPQTIAVGATASALYAYDLPSRTLLWQHALKTGSAPHVAGPYALVEVGDEIQGFELRSGKRRFAFDREGKSLQGADGEGDAGVITLGSGHGTSAHSEVIVVRDGSVRWRRAIPGQGGVAAIVGSIVLVPWSTQFLSALELDDGSESARMRVRDGVLSHALRAPSATFVGSYHGLARLSSAIASGKLKAGGTLALPAQELPGRPLLLPDVQSAARNTRVDSAEHHIGVAFTPALLRSGRLGLQDDTLYAFFYRFVYALDPRSGAVRWMRVLESDVVGARAQRQGVLVGEERGRISFLAAASGTTRFTANTGRASLALRLPDGGAGDQPAGRAPNAGALRAQLVAAIQDPDARLAPARSFAVQQLARLQPPEVTAELVAICDSDSMTPPVRERACLELRQRPNGTDAILTALGRHAGYLEGTTSPQVGALATAAASLKLVRAAPLLVAHLADPATRSSDLPALVTALGDLGNGVAVPGLSDFLQLYHADSSDPHLVRALELVPATLVKLQAVKTQSQLRAVATDELGIYSVRQQARSAADALAQPPAPPPATAQATEPAPTPPEPTPAPTSAPEQTALPARLTADMLETALRPAHDALQSCLANANPPQVHARILLVVSEGRAQTVSVVPALIQGCVESLIRAQPFPVTTARTPERLSYTLKRDTPTQPP